MPEVFGTTRIGHEIFLFSYEDQNLTVYKDYISVTNDEIKETEAASQQFFCGQMPGFMSGGKILFHTELPITIDNLQAKYSQKVDWLITNYQESTYYTEVNAEFPELDYFMPSSSIASIEKDKVTVSRKPIVAKGFDIDFKDRVIHIAIRMLPDISYKPFKDTEFKTKVQIHVTFEKTDDYAFLIAIYSLIENVFSFICNRRNIAISGLKLEGNYSGKTIRNNKIVNEKILTNQNLIIYEKYKEPIEDIKVIGKTPCIKLFESHLQELFQLVANNFDNGEGTVSILSIHPSAKRRNLIDLQQTLQIVAAFEFYQRTYLPAISSDRTIEAYEEIDFLLDGYIQKYKGKDAKKKKVAEDIKKHLAPDISLKDKLKKAYDGYKDWAGLSGVLDTLFKNHVDQLAEVANDWRNELAHEKRSYEPTPDVVSAVRMVEYINYCIILRKSGYDDSDIKNIIDVVLQKPGLN